MFLLKSYLGALLMPLPFSLVLLLIGLLLLWFSDRWSRKQLLGKLLVSAGVGVLLVASLPSTSLMLGVSLERNFPPLFEAPTDLEYVIVLGGGHRSDPNLPSHEQLDSSTYRRVMQGVSLMRANPDATLLVSGYGGSDPVSSAELASTVAQQAGIPSAQIQLFDVARDTEEEAKLIAPLIKQHKTALVTSASHMPRALSFFHAQGVKPVPAPTDYFGKEPQNSLFFYQKLPKAGALAEVTAAWHEIVGVLWREIKE